MKIIRWLLSHSFLILLVVVVIYGYMFWGNLLGKDTPAGKAVAYLSSEFVAVEEFVNAVKEKQARLNGSQPPQQTSGQAEIAESSQAGAAVTEIDKTPDQPEPATTEFVQRNEASVYAAQQADNHREKQAGAIPVNDNIAQVQANSNAAAVAGSETETKAEEQLALADSPAISQTINQKNNLNSSTTDIPQRSNTKATAEKAVSPSNNTPGNIRPGNITLSDADQSGANLSKSEQTFVSHEIEKQLENVDKQGKVIDKSQTSDGIKADWITARKSFYQRNYDLSEQSYQNVIDNTEDNFDAYGELGNVYFNQGKNQQAASAYFEAAAILVRKGQVSRARSLMGLLRHLDKSKASELQQLIESAIS